MELIPFLIFAVIAFNIFKGFTKTASKPQSGTAKTMMRRLHAEIEKANKLQSETPNMSRYREKSPTQRGRESLQSKGQSSPWNHEHDLGDSTRNLSPGEQVAANYLKKTKLNRKASHKSPTQHGRRGKNMDQNKHRTDGWGQRGDSGFLNGKTILILLVIGGAVLYALSQMPAT